MKSIQTNDGDYWVSDIANPGKLFLTWFFLFYYQKQEWDESYSGKYVYLDEAVRLCMEDYKTRNYLSELYKDGIIKSLYLNQYYDDKPKGNIFFITAKKPKTLPKDVTYQKEIPEIGSGDFRYYDISAEIDENRSKQFINEYLEKWANNSLYFLENNILRKEKQIERVVRDIFEIIKDHSHYNFLVHEANKKEVRNEVDFVATILFLQKIGDIQCTGFFSQEIFNDYYSLTKKALHFRLSLTDKFFEDFSYSKKTGQVHFNFHDLTSGSRKSKIYFDTPFRLWTKKSEYRLNKGKLPYELLNAAFDDAAIQSVQVQELEVKLDNDEKDMQKGLGNLRRKLREKFDYPDSEQFFTVQNDEILLDSKIFKKSIKKEEIA